MNARKWRIELFTGIITGVGTIKHVSKNQGITKFEVDSPFSVEDIDIGASIMHSGVCLTVVEKRGKEHSTGSIYAVEAVPETLQTTVLNNWKAGTTVNLEQSMKIGEEIGGHFVFGHVDGIGTVTKIQNEKGSYRVSIRAPKALNRYIARKGSIALDGVSLTVASAPENGEFEVAIIPHTWTHTTFETLVVDSHVNIEIDMLARYVARAIEYDCLSRIENT